MTNQQQTPWAILLCKFKDNQSETPVPDFRTVCERFFTTPGAGFNAVQFFSDMSHGRLDLSGSQVLGWFTLDVNVNDVVPPTDPPPPGWTSKKSQDEMMTLAKQAATNAGVALNRFFADVLIMNVATGWAQGGPSGVFADWRRVDGRNFDGSLGPRATGGGNGTEIFGQEMGHGYGLGHSRRDGSTADYQDCWDIMSTKNNCSVPDPDYCARGPGLNAWNMRGRGWLDELRVWHTPSGLFDQVVQLNPLHRHDLPELLAAELPPNDGTGGQGRYLVEFRIKEAWDAGISRPAVFVHRFLTASQDNDGWSHSYIMSGTNSNQDLVKGDGFRSLSTGGACLKVLNIDEQAQVATVRLNYTPLARVACATNLQNDLHICAIDGSDGLWHTMRLGDGSWPMAFGDVQAQTRQAGPNPGIGPTPFTACATNPQGDLHVLAIDMQNGLWHTIRQTDGSWPMAFGDVQAQTRQVGPNSGIGPTPFTACATNSQGDLHVLAIDMHNGLWHTIRQADGSWPMAFGDVQAQTRQVGPNPGIGPTPFVACATNSQGDLHVLAIDMQNGLWHTMRLGDGSWPMAFGDVQAQTRQVGPNPGIGPTPFVACATNSQGDLHVLALDEHNGLWHTIRKADGSWPMAFGDVQAQVGPNLGIGPTPFVACAIDQQDTLHVLALDLNNILWHMVRLTDGSWPMAFEHIPSKVIGL